MILCNKVLTERSWWLTDNCLLSAVISLSPLQRNTHNPNLLESWEEMIPSQNASFLYPLPFTRQSVQGGPCRLSILYHVYRHYIEGRLSYTIYTIVYKTMEQCQHCFGKKCSIETWVSYSCPPPDSLTSARKLRSWQACMSYNSCFDIQNFLIFMLWIKNSPWSQSRPSCKVKVPCNSRLALHQIQS